MKTELFAQNSRQFAIPDYGSSYSDWIREAIAVLNCIDYTLHPTPHTPSS
ncbi:MAG: hypothetical protein MJA27_15395 [Pseudanabaenales cyanobacterium]|nr:hypothetical protein [Pseudanabaenales cyanobacterium]